MLVRWMICKVSTNDQSQVECMHAWMGSSLDWLRDSPSSR